MIAVTDPGDSDALLILVLPFSVVEICPRENFHFLQKGQFPEKSSKFRPKFVVLMNLTRILFEDLVIMIKIRPNLLNLVTLIGRYRVIHDHFTFFDKRKSVGWGQNLTK